MRPSRIYIVLILVSLSLVLPQALFSVQRNQSASWNSIKPGFPVEGRIEPLIRVGLATDVKSAVISTSGLLLHAFGEDEAQSPLTAARIRVEPRSLSPAIEIPSGGEYQVEVAGLRDRPEAERASKDLAAVTGQQTDVTRITGTDEWAVRVGAWPSQREAKELRDFLEGEGFIMSRVVSRPSRMNAHAAPGPESAAIQPKSRPTVAPTVRSSSPGGEMVVFGSGNSQIFAARVPVVFSSADVNSAPVRFNEKPYRGRLEVFRNSRGNLTVVNVLGLEDYVRGVVANELSPEVFPELEALKAQAVAARTYAVRHRNQFASMGFDLLPTTRSQVYGGIGTERPLSSRAVDETRGVIATFRGQPIDALYTSTCGGRTENAEVIFGGAGVPYLSAVECSVESHSSINQFIVSTGREPVDIRDERNIEMARATALLAVHGFSLPKRITDSWLLAPPSTSETEGWLSLTSRLARQTSTPKVSNLRPGEFAVALSIAVFGEDRGDALLSKSDVDYYLPFRDAGEIAQQQRAAVAFLVRDGVISSFPDGSLHPSEPMSRARVLRAFARILESRQLFDLKRAVARPSSGSSLLVRVGKGPDQPLAIAPGAYLLAVTGGGAFQVRHLSVIGGESVAFHEGPGDNIDYLEVRPAQSGASADRFSGLTNWAVELSLAEVASRLSRYVRLPGTLTDIRVISRGASRRVTELEVTGTSGVARLKGGRIRSALGLKEQLFVIDRRFDSQGRVSGVLLTGRGFGHGVGMCQVGSFGLAKAGYSFKEILEHYYTGIDLSNMYE